MDIEIPIIILVVIGSPNITAPMRIAVIGSNTPNTDAFVGPIFLDAIAKVAVETIVGRTASPTRYNKAVLLSYLFLLLCLYQTL